MRLLGLKIERMDSSIQKVLKPGWYPFGDYPEPKADGYLKVKPVSHEEKSIYRLRNHQPEVSVSCIVGMNGSGKSTIIEIIFRILNNLAMKQCGKIPQLIGTDMEYAYGVYADLYCECGEYVNLIRCRNDKMEIYRYRESARSFSLMDEGRMHNKLLSQLFYTIGVNYSLYAYNGESFQSNTDEEINGSWLTGVFHKNDGYLAPLTLVPYRDEGEISMSKENELAMQRITVLSILSRSKGRQFPEGYYPYKLHYALNLKYDEEKLSRFVKNYQPKFPWIDINNLVSLFQKSWIRLFKAFHLDIHRNETSSEYILALFYLSYKGAKIALTYNDYSQILGLGVMVKLYEEKKEDELNKYVNSILESKVWEVVIGLYRDEDDHITLKIHQTLRYLENNYWQSKGDVTVEDLLSGIKPQTYDDVVRILPPPIYNLDVTFEKARRRAGKWHGDELWDSSVGWGDESRNSFRLSSMSSGERQVLVAISYVLYHIKNLQSVEDSVYRVKYHHVCVVFDEVELYFHPDYQRKFLSMLIESLSWANIDRRKIKSIHIMIATHSPFVLTDVLTERTLYLREGVREKVTSQTFGGNYYDLLDNSFFFRTTAIGEISARATRRWIRKNDSENQGKLSAEVMSMVGDPFVKRYLQVKHTKKEESDVQTEETDE